MEFERRELRDDGRGASFYVSSSSSAAARYPSDAGLSRYSISALGSSSQPDQVRQLSYNTDSTFLKTRHCSGPPGPSLWDPLLDPSYREDLELEIRCDHLREVANKIELAHYRMLEAHDRRALAIAEQGPYARCIPFYPVLPPDNGWINNTAQGDTSEVQKNLNVGPDGGPRAGVEGPPILRKEVVPHVGLDRARSHYQPIGPVEAVCPVGPARDVWIDERPGHDPILQNQFTGYNMMLLPQIIHELPPPLVVPVPVPVPTTENKIGSSAGTNKKRKKEYGQGVIQVKPTMRWSKWPCVWCSVNFDSKEAMDAHLKEQHQGCKGNGPSESEKVENNRNEETRTGLTVTSDGDQKEISEVSGSRTNEKIQLYLPPANLKRKSNELQKGNVVPTPENKEVAGSDTNKKIKLVLPLFCSTRKSDESNKEEVEPTLEDKEIAGSSTTKKIKPYSPPSNLGLMPNELVQNPDDKEIVGSSINRNTKLDLSPSNLKQISDEPSEEEVVQIPENKDIAGSSINRNTKLDLSPSNIKKTPDGPSKEEVVPIPENKDIAGSSINRNTKLDLSPLNLKQIPDEPSKEEVVPIPENKEIAGSSINRNTKLDLSPLNLKQIPDEPSKEEVVPIPENKEIAGSSVNRKKKLDLPPSNSKQIPSKPSKKEVVPTPENKKKPATGVMKLGWIVPEDGWFCDLCKINTLPERTLDDHFQSRAHLEKLNAVPNGSQKSEPASKIVAVKPVQVVSQAVFVPKLGEQKEKTSKSILMPQSDKLKEVSQAVSVPELEEQKERTSKSILMPQSAKQKEVLSQDKGNPSSSNRTVITKGHEKTVEPASKFSKKKNGAPGNAHQEKLNALAYGSLKSEPANKIVAKKPVQGLSQAVAVPKLEEAKEETSKSIPMPQSDKLKEAASQDKGKPSSNNRMVILTGHKKTAQQTLKFSNSKNSVPVNGIPKPVLVMKNGKWFCNLCKVKMVHERSKEEHIKGKRHRMNLQSQALSHTPEPNEPSAKLSWCYICNICFTNENGLIAHINEKKHHQALMKPMHFV